MPFPGIATGSPLEKKIDRCMDSVMAKQPKLSKSAAIAICRSSLKKATTTKTRRDAIQFANYRDAGPASTQICSTCKFGQKGKNCSFWSFTYDTNFICNSYLPDIEATKKRGQELRKGTEEKDATGNASPITAHGPGGLFSTPGLTKRRKKKKGGDQRYKTAVILTMIKRSRGGGEQRAMFAKMGSAGSLQGKGPTGARTGKKLPKDATDRAFVERLTRDAAREGKSTPEGKILPPSGRAPTGQGKEYAARRWVHKRTVELKKKRDNRPPGLANDRGQRSLSSLRTASQIRSQAFGQTLDVVRHMITSLDQAGMSFADARGLFSELFALPPSLHGGIK